MKMISSVGVLVVLLVCTEASMFRGPLSSDENGSYCEGPEQTRIEIGEEKRINCFDCSCSQSGISCIGVGYNAGVMSMPGCSRKELDDCCYQFFKDDDPSESCSPVRCP